MSTVLKIRFYPAKSTSHEMKIALNDYKKLLAQIQKTISETKQDIVQSVNREKVEMCWQIGKILDEHLLKNNSSSYGKKLFHDLAKDVLIEKRTLYQMCSFYKTYPTLPAHNLNWSHYRNLVTVKNEEKRKLLEDLALTNQLGAKDLQREIVKSKPRAQVKKIPTKLKIKRGKPFTYTLTKSGEIDLGFNIFLEKSFANLRQAQESKGGEYTYKAELERVVDGDTIHVKLDLGFGIKHHEILRLAKINAAESETTEGKKATTALKKILKDLPFLIVKTNNTDIYGRYIADVFYGKGSPEKVAENGEYLNQLLLDRGLVEIY